MFLFTIQTLCIQNFDQQGILYESPTYEVLVLAPKDIEICTIYRSTKILKSNCFKYCQKLTKIEFDEYSNVESIEKAAFYGCIKLNFINLSSCRQLTVLSPEAFCQTLSLSTIIFPPYLKFINSLCLASSGLESVIIPLSVKQISAFSFAYCNHLKELVFEKNSSLTHIGCCAFCSSSLTNVWLPGTILSMEAPFCGCFMLDNISIDASAKQYIISENTVYSSGKSTIIQINPNLTGLFKIPTTVTSLLSYCFAMSLVSQIDFGNTSINYIPLYAFGDCKNLQNVYIPSGCERLGPEIFNGCISLSIIFLPKTIISIYKSAFVGIPKHCEIIFEQNSSFTIIDNLLLDYQKKTLLMHLDTKGLIDNVSIPDTVETISPFVFKAFNGNIKFGPNSNLTEIGESAFEDANCFNSLILPIKCHIIGRRSFYHSSIRYIEIPSAERVTIGNEAFARSALTSIIFPKNISEIILSEGIFYKCNHFCEIILPDIEIIPAFMFQGCKNLTNIYIPKNVATISDFAFAQSGLCVIGFENGSLLQKICRSSFENCNIMDFDVPPLLQTIEYFAFANCHSLEIMIIGESTNLSFINHHCFQNCIRFLGFLVHPECKRFFSDVGILFNKIVTELIFYPPYSHDLRFSIPDTVQIIAAYAFCDCEKLVSVTLGRVHKIGYSAFRGCLNLRHVVLGNTINEIHGAAFEGCPSLACGSFEYLDGITHSEIVDMLLESGVPPVAVVPCPTIHFTNSITRFNGKGAIAAILILARGRLGRRVVRHY